MTSSTSSTQSSSCPESLADSLRSYRLNAEDVSSINGLLQKFQGTLNYQNFTRKKGQVLKSLASAKLLRKELPKTEFAPRVANTSKPSVAGFTSIYQSKAPAQLQQQQPEATTGDSDAISSLVSSPPLSDHSAVVSSMAFADVSSSNNVNPSSSASPSLSRKHPLPTRTAPHDRYKRHMKTVKLVDTFIFHGIVNCL